MYRAKDEAEAVMVAAVAAANVASGMFTMLWFMLVLTESD